MRTSADFATSGAILLDEGRAGEAVKAFEQALSLAPRKAAYCYDLALALLQEDEEARRGASRDAERDAQPDAKRGASSGALRCARMAAELEPGDPLHWNVLGLAALAAGGMEEAEAAFDRASALAPDAAEFRNHGGVARFKAGDYRGAAARFREALERDPGLEEARLNLEDALARIAGEEGDEA